MKLSKANVNVAHWLAFFSTVVRSEFENILMVFIMWLVTESTMQKNKTQSVKDGTAVEDGTQER